MAARLAASAGEYDPLAHLIFASAGVKPALETL
jgi:hypothetical protein